MSNGSLWVDNMNRCGAAVSPDNSGRSAAAGLVPGSQVTDRSAGTGLAVKGVVLVFASMLLILAPRVFAQDEPILAIAVGNPGSPSYKFGLGLMSLFQAAALPDGTKMRIEIWHSLSPSERIAVLLEEVQLAVIRAGEAEREDRRAQQQIRAAVGLPDGNQVLVRADLSDDLVYNITRLVFEHSDLMRSAYPEVGNLEPSASLMRIQGGAHSGALRYYEEQRQLQSPPALPPPATVPVGKSRGLLLIPRVQPSSRVGKAGRSHRGTVLMPVRGQPQSAGPAGGSRRQSRFEMPSMGPLLHPADTVFDRERHAARSSPVLSSAKARASATIAF